MRQHTWGPNQQPATLSRATAWAINLRSRQGTSNLTHYNGPDMTDGGQACILSDWEGGREGGTSGWMVGMVFDGTGRGESMV